MPIPKEVIEAQEKSNDLEFFKGKRPDYVKL